MTDELLTDTNLDLLRQKEYIRIISVNISGCLINFWTTDKEWKGYVESRIFSDSERSLKIISSIMQTIQFGKKYKERFKYIDVVFIPDWTKILKNISAQITVVETGIAVPKEETLLGRVLPRDSDEKKNIIYLELAEIDTAMMNQAIEDFSNQLQSKGLSEKEALQKAESLIEEIEKKAEKLFIETLIGTLSHELTHLWHVKQSEAREAFERSRELFAKYILPEEQKYDAEAYSKRCAEIFNKIKNNALTEEEMRNVIPLLKQFYIILRERLEAFEHYLVIEGMANFMASYINGTYDYQKIKEKAEKMAKVLINDFNVFIKSFMFIMKSYMPSFQNVEEIREISDPEKCLKEFNNILIMYQRFHGYPYSIGPIIPATLYEYGMQIKDIGAIEQKELIRTYEDVCVQKGIIPLVAIRPGTKAAFNISDAAATMNALRKELGIK